MINQPTVADSHCYFSNTSTPSAASGTVLYIVCLSEETVFEYSFFTRCPKNIFYFLNQVELLGL